MNTGDWERDFDFVKDVGRKTLEAITTIVNQHKEIDWTARRKRRTTVKERTICGV